MHAHKKAPPPVVANMPPAPRATVAGLLSDGQRFKSLSAAERRRELAQAKARYREHGSLDNLMRLALLTALSDSDQPDGAHVLGHLRAYVNRGKGGGGRWGPLAALLLHVLDERERLVQERRSLQRKLDRHEADVRRLNQKLDRHKADEQRLSDKLDQLKAIEQKLNERSKRDVMKMPP